MIIKLGHIFLSILLIVSTVGVVISRHYCGDNLVSTAFYLSADSCCENMNGECCHNEEETLMLKAEYINPEIEENHIAEIILFNRASIQSANNYLSSCDAIFLLSGPSSPPEVVSLAQIQSFLL